MKITVLSNAPSHVEFFKAAKHVKVIRKMPCEVVECYDLPTALDNISNSDIILVGSQGELWPPYWNDIADILVEGKKSIGVFSVDAFRPLFWGDYKPIKVDLVIPSMKFLYKIYQAKNYSCPYFWMPPSVELYDSNVERDIDILVWGNNGLPSYGLRNYVLNLLESMNVGKVETIDEVEYRTIRIGDIERIYALVPYRNILYWGENIRSVISRAKMCCTGSGSMNCITGKYFENAVCGTLTVSGWITDMEDLGFRHGENIWITDHYNYHNDIEYLIHNLDYVIQMGQAAKQLIRERHTTEIRAKQLYDYLKEFI